MLDLVVEVSPWSLGALLALLGLTVCLPRAGQWALVAGISLANLGAWWWGDVGLWAGAGVGALWLTRLTAPLVVERGALAAREASVSPAAEIVQDASVAPCDAVMEVRQETKALPRSELRGRRHPEWSNAVYS